MASSDVIEAAWISGAVAIVAALIPIAMAIDSGGSPSPDPPPTTRTAPSPTTTTSRPTTVRPSPTPPPVQNPSPQRPAITLSARSGPPGAPLVITGKGFRSSATIYIGAGEEEVDPVTARTTESGEFRIRFDMPALKCNGVPVLILAYDILTDDQASAVYMVTSGSIC